MSKVYNLKKVQLISGTLDEVWDYFSNPRNLAAITPASMRFNVISAHHGNNMYPGQVIEYYVSPVLQIPLYWMTEITHVDDRRYFVDEQRFGPYNLWHHQHHFKEINGQVEMTDIVHYKLPLWFLGDIAHALFVQKKLEEIFDYRYSEIDKLFTK